MRHHILHIYILLCLTFTFSFQHETHIKNYNDHPCIRPCNNQTLPKICKYNWTIEWYSVLSKACLDCPFNKTSCTNQHCVTGNGVIRPIMVINRMLPGPPIVVCQGDTIDILLYNSLHLFEATSIHWHGLRQRGTPYMDGVSMITQCPIISHTFFQYEFTADTSGTHLYHGHSGLQRADGVFGPIVVREYENSNSYFKKYDYDLVEHIITLNDWLNQTSIAKFAGHHHNDGDNKPDSILINGKGDLHKFYDKDENEIRTPIAEFVVSQGKRYRFRLINAGILYCPIEFSIEDHNITVIASDGFFLEENTVESLVIYAGERYDFILTANKMPKNYWIRAKGLADCSVNKVFQKAILKYNESIKMNSNTLSNMSNVNYFTIRPGLQLNPWNKAINETNKKEFKSINELKSIETGEIEMLYKTLFDRKTQIKKHYLAMEFNKINNLEFHDENFYSLGMLNLTNRQPIYTPQINNISMKMPSKPVLYEWDSVPQDEICNHLNRDHICPNREKHCSCVYLLEFDIGDVVEFVIVDEGFTFQSNHPMHLHGASFAILAMQKLNRSIKIDEVIKMDEMGKITRNFDRPPIKDTVTVPVGGYTIIRFLADNPGTWMFHCHLDFHSEVGMGMLIKVGEKKDLPSEPLNWPKCGSYLNEHYAEHSPLVSSFPNVFNSKQFSLIILIIFFMFLIILNNTLL